MRKGKYEEEKNRLYIVRKLIGEAIEEVENGQRAFVAKDLYEQAIIYREFVKILKTIKTECGIVGDVLVDEKPKQEDKIE